MAFSILNGMKITIDKAGRIVVPKPVRERLGLRPDMELEAIERPDGVFIKRAEQLPSLIKADGLWVHRGVPEPGANWDRAVEDARDERIRSILKI
jgi:AbrB family looped-hinge helix DNA binding protein